MAEVVHSGTFGRGTEKELMTMTDIKKGGTTLMHLVCAALFLVFTFCYLYFYQADVLAATQHVLSDGRTHYDRTIGAIIITVTLFLFQVAVYKMTHLERRSHAMTYFPSLLILTVLTSASPQADGHLTIGVWLWAAPLLLILFILWARMSRKFQPFEPDTNSSGFFSRLMWINVLTLAVMFLLTGCLSDHNDVLHYRLRAEDCLLRGDYAGAAEAGHKAQATDSSLTMIRAYALSMQGQMADRLFTYPLTGGSDALLPNGSSVRLVLFPEAEIYRKIGPVTIPKMRPKAYFAYLQKRHLGRANATDYLLISYLLDCDLDSFADALSGHYQASKPLPKHYKEALTLYNHTRSNPKLEYHDTVTEADYADFMRLYRSEKNPTARRAKAAKTFGATYWFYYHFR